MTIDVVWVVMQPLCLLTSCSHSLFPPHKQLLMVVVGCAMVVVMVMNHPESIMSESTRSDDHSPDQNPGTDIPVTLWKRVQCCPGMAMSNPHLYLSIPMSRLSRCYPYLCHALHVFHRLRTLVLEMAFLSTVPAHTMRLAPLLPLPIQ